MMGWFYKFFKIVHSANGMQNSNGWCGHLNEFKGLAYNQSFKLMHSVCKLNYKLSALAG